MLGKVGGGGGDDLKGTGRGRRLPLQAAIDVSVPVEVAYDQWTQFEDFPKFMFRVERIEQKDDTHLIWHEKIWGIRRQWEAEIVEQRLDRLLAKGVVVAGEVTLSIADVDLVHVSLRALIMSVRNAAGLSTAPRPVDGPTG